MTYRDDLEAERAKADALEAKADELARENAELHAKLEHPHPEPPPKPEPKPPTTPAASPSRARSHAWLLVALFISFLGAIQATGCVSGTMKLAAPIVCPKGYDRSIVVLHVRGTSRGGTSYSGDLWCAFPEKKRFPVNADTFAVLGVLFGEWLLVTVVLGLLVRLLVGRRKRTE